MAGLLLADGSWPMAGLWLDLARNGLSALSGHQLAIVGLDGLDWLANGGHGCTYLLVRTGYIRSWSWLARHAG